MIFVPSFQTGSRFDNGRTKNCTMFCLASRENSTSEKALSCFILFIRCSLKMALNIFLIAFTVPKLSRFNCENSLSGSRFESGNGATNMEILPSSPSFYVKPVFNKDEAKNNCKTLMETFITIFILRTDKMFIYKL